MSKVGIFGEVMLIILQTINLDIDFEGVKSNVAVALVNYKIN